MKQNHYRLGSTWKGHCHRMISVILFVIGLNILIRAAERESRGPHTNTGIRLQSNRGFMEDMTITTKAHIQVRWILQARAEAVAWARILFKTGKSMCLIVWKRKVTDRFKLTIKKEDIPTLLNKHVKWRKTKTASWRKAKENNQVRTPRKVKYKAWIFQDSLLARLIGPLMINEIPISLVEKLEQLVSKHLRRWLGLPPLLTSLGLYSQSSKLQSTIRKVQLCWNTSAAYVMTSIFSSISHAITCCERVGQLDAGRMSF
jgi:hypothetical protein